MKIALRIPICKENLFEKTTIIRFIKFKVENG